MTVQNFTLTYSGTEFTPTGLNNHTTGTFTASVTNTNNNVTGTWAYSGSYDVPGQTHANGTISLTGTFTTRATLSDGWSLNMLSSDPAFQTSATADLAQLGSGGYELIDIGVFDESVLLNNGNTTNAQFVFYSILLPIIPPPTIFIEKWPDYVHESTTPVSTTITLFRQGFALTSASTVEMKITDGSAVTGTDYNPVLADQIVTFAAGQQSVTLKLATILNDGAVTGDKTFDVTLSNVTNGSLGSPATETVTILDGNGGPMVETANFYNEKLTGGTGSDTLTGGDAVNTVTGKIGIDTLIGLGGDDTLIGGPVDAHSIMYGGAGNDTYVVTISATPTGLFDFNGSVYESSNQGNDTIILNGGTVALARPTLVTLPVNIENLDASQTGTTPLNLKGNAESNILTANDANNITLDGGAGAGTWDTLIGGAGNDTFIIHSANDVIIEQPNTGENTAVIEYNNTNTLAADTVSLASYANVENITIKGTGLFNVVGDSGDNILIGNAYANTITGGGGNDTMDGGGGLDTLIGGSGNDTYIIENSSDVVTDSGGANLVIDKAASGTFTMSANLDVLTMQGAGNLGAVANNDGDTITGNTGINTIVGGSGADTIDGGLGHDILTGGGGADTFVFTHLEAASSANYKTITDFTPGSGGDILDISDVLAGHYSSGSLANFVHLLSDGHGGTEVLVNATGSGTVFIEIADLKNVAVATLIDADHMVTNGNLIA